MKNMKQLITLMWMAASVACTNAQTGLPAIAGAEDAPGGGGGFGHRSVGAGKPPTTASAKVYAQNAFSDAGVVYGYATRSSGSSVPPVVIQFGSKSTDAIATMEEHLAIMTQIIDDALARVGEDGPDEKMGIKLYYTSGGKSVRALYLENFGPLFMVKVNFPVHGPATMELKETEKPDDSEWNDARRRVLGFPDEKRWTGGSSGVPYDAARVEDLKKQLIAALKNATNMKGVKPDEFVTVTVFGSPAASGDTGREWTTSPGGRGASVGATRLQTVVSSDKDSARSSSQGTVLTLRIKKSDIDAAKEDTAALAKKTLVHTYAGNGHGLSSVNSWIRSSSSLQVR